jgi:ABC-type sugar transport system permease subunit
MGENQRGGGELLRKRRDHTAAYLLLLPALALFGVFVIYPFIYGAYISLHKWDGFGAMQFTGLSNYVRALKDSDLLKALWHNVLYAVGTVSGKLLVSFTLAMLLNRKFKGTTFFRAIFFVPVVLSFVTVGTLWQRIYDPVLGLLDNFLMSLHIISKPIQWLADPKLALWSLVLVDIWKWAGYHAVLFLAGLQTIPDELYESAAIDGANAWRRLTNITLPQLRSMILMNMTIALMGAFSVFDLVFTMTKGGPYKSTDVILTYMYTKTFGGSNSNFGYGSAVAYILFAIILVITIFQTRLMNRGEE